MRYTVDLEQDRRRQLRLFALDHQVDASEVIRTLIGLLDDPTVAGLVAGRLGGPAAEAWEGVRLQD